MDGSWKWGVPCAVVGAVGLGILMFRRYYAGVECKSKVLMKQKTVLITGANCGLGKATALELAKRGARLILACRDVSKAEKAANEIRRAVPDVDIVIKHLDLASLESIRQFSSMIIDEEPKIDVLINNAGVYQCPFWKTEDGFEMQMGVNHLGHFYLTRCLKEKMIASAPSRIVVVSSGLHKLGEIEFDNIVVPCEEKYNMKRAYYDSKLANCLFARVLAKQLDPSQVCVYTVKPGMVRTNLGRHVQIPMLMKVLFYPLYWLLAKSPYDGAQTVLFCSIAAEISGDTGKYYSNCQAIPWTEQALDDKAAQALWDLSEKLTGLQ